jgi:voltage-gated potassium channel
MHVRGNFAYLLGALLGFLFLVAILAQYPEIGGNQILMFSVEMTLIVGVWSIVRQRFWFVFGLVLIAIGAVNILLDAIIHHSWAPFVNLVVALLFYLFTTALAFRALLTGERIDINMIMGSICVYILVGISWSILYLFAAVIHPDAFDGVHYTTTKQLFIDLLYYSFVTLSTLGYGDITPITPIARTLAYIEALFGQFYIAILVASFVGMHISRGNKKSD